MDFEDVSSNNPTPNITRMADAGIDVLAAKCSGNPNGYAWDYVWSQGGVVADQARAAGFRVIRYHFGHPGVSGARQAAVFLAHTNPADLPCFDAEGGSWAPGELVDVIGEFAAEVGKHRDPGVTYGSSPFFEAQGLIAPPPELPLAWVAAYPTLLTLPGAWQRALWAHQYSDRGLLPGMAAPGDVNHLLGQLPGTPRPVPKPPAAHHCDGATQVWWDGHGCVDVHNPDFPHNARGVTRDGELMGYVTAGMKEPGWHALHAVPSTATVTGYTWATNKGWRQS